MTGGTHDAHVPCAARSQTVSAETAHQHFRNNGARVRAEQAKNSSPTRFRQPRNGHHSHPIRRAPHERDPTMDNDLDQAKGKIKQAAGDLTDDNDLKREGKVDEAAGKVKEGAEKAKDKVGDVVDSVKDKLDN